MDRAAKYVAKMDPAISGQHGHDRAFHTACVLVRDFDLTVDEAWPVFCEWNTTCQPPWSERELRRKLDQADKEPGDRGKLRDANNGSHQRTACSSSEVFPNPNHEVAHKRVSPDGRPEIVVTTDEHDVNDQAIEALAADEGVYCMQGVSFTWCTTAGIIRGLNGRITRPAYRTCSNRSYGSGCREPARFMKRIESDDGVRTVEAHVPDWTVKAIHARGNYPGIRSLEAVVEYPGLAAGRIDPRFAGLRRLDRPDL